LHSGGLDTTDTEHATGAARLTAALERALECDETFTRRLVYAHATVGFRVEGARAATLMLDAAAPRLDHHVPPAEVEIELDARQADDFAHGRLLLPAAVARGEVGAQGPVRKYLEVDPILRGMLKAGNGTGAGLATGGERQRTSTNGGIAPDLLAIQTVGLRKSFGAQPVLAGLNLEIPEGVVAVVLGPSGTGKSVLLQHVIGLMKADAGEVAVRGRLLSEMNREELLALRRQIGVMFQDGALLSTMNVYDNTAFPLRQHTDLNEAEISEVVMERLRDVGLAEAARRMPNELSGGMRKRAGLARSMVLEPSILLCDEPDSGLDPVRAALLSNLLLKQHERMGGTILVVTHDISLARRIADHMSLIWRGNVVASGFVEDVLQSEDPFVRQFLAGDPDGPLRMS
jgi:phospholipid/cholesterol/gamma-HCH transport system ATP-binding protein